jgi:hypothetical protein
LAERLYIDDHVCKRVQGGKGNLMSINKTVTIKIKRQLTPDAQKPGLRKKEPVSRTIGSMNVTSA